MNCHSIFLNSIAFEVYEDSTISHKSLNSSPSMPSFGGLFEIESVSNVQEPIDERKPSMKII